MANLPESSNFDAGVYQLETTDPVVGGANGVSNTPLKNLANRTKYLKDHIDAIEAAYAPKASPAFTGTPTAPNLTIRQTGVSRTDGLTISPSGHYADGLFVYQNGSNNPTSIIENIWDTTGTPIQANIALNPSGGNVGVRTSTPAYPLDVNGDARVSGTLYVGTLSSSSLAPLPNNTSGSVGYLKNFYVNSGGTATYTLPSGGQYAVIVVTGNSNGTVGNSIGGVYAGGSTISVSGQYILSGVYWRIA